MEEFIFKDRKIYYRKNKFDPNKQTIVFIHGVSGSSSAWVLYEDKFRHDYNILSFDLRGHGKSHRYKKYKDYKIDEFAEDLHQLIKFLNIEKFIMISHSYGTFVALEFISKHEEYVEASILLSPNYNVNLMPTSKPFKAFLKIATKLKIPISNKKIRKHIDYSKYINTSDFDIKRTIADLDNTGLQVYFMCTKQSFLLNYEKLLNKIKIPVLIISGEKDTIFPVKYAKEINKKIKNSELVIIKNTNHILVLNNFNEVSELIGKFVTKIKNNN